MIHRRCLFIEWFYRGFYELSIRLLCIWIEKTNEGTKRQNRNAKHEACCVFEYNTAKF